MKKILVCDDDQEIVDLIKIILENNGYRVSVLTSGEIALEKIKAYLPDLILLDIWMPGLDSEKITKTLKENAKTKHIPIIIISALSNLKKLAKDIGADSFISKPFDIDYLTKVVEKYTGKR